MIGKFTQEVLRRGTKAGIESILAAKASTLAPYRPPSYVQPVDILSNFEELEDVSAPRHDIWRMREHDTGKIFRAKSLILTPDYAKDGRLAPEILDEAFRFEHEREVVADNIAMILASDVSRKESKLGVKRDDNGYAQYYVLGEEIEPYLSLEQLCEQPFFVDDCGYTRVWVDREKQQSARITGRIEAKLLAHALDDTDPNPLNIGFGIDPKNIDPENSCQTYKIDNEFCFGFGDPALASYLENAKLIASGLTYSIFAPLNLSYLEIRRRNEVRSDIVAEFAQEFRKGTQIRDVLHRHFWPGYNPDFKQWIGRVGKGLVHKGNTYCMADELIKQEWNPYSKNADEHAQDIIRDFDFLPDTPEEIQEKFRSSGGAKGVMTR